MERSDIELIEASMKIDGRTTIYERMRLAAGSDTGRPRSLTAAQERQVFRWVNGRDPRQYGLDFGL